MLAFLPSGQKHSPTIGHGGMFESLYARNRTPQRFRVQEDVGVEGGAGNNRGDDVVGRGRERVDGES